MYLYLEKCIYTLIFTHYHIIFQRIFGENLGSCQNLGLVVSQVHNNTNFLPNEGKL